MIGNPFDLPDAGLPPKTLAGEVAFLLHWAALSGVGRGNAELAWRHLRTPADLAAFHAKARAILSPPQQEAA